MPVAVAGVAAIDVVAVAFAAMLIAFALTLFVTFTVVPLVQQLPGVGYAVAGVLQSAVASGQAQVNAWASNATQPAADLILNWYWTTRTLAEGWTHGLQSVYNVLATIISVRIPTAVNSVVQYAENAAAAAQQYAESLYRVVEIDLSAATAQLGQDIVAAENAATAYTQAVASDLGAQIQQVEQTAVAYTEAVAQGLASDIAQVETTATAYTSAIAQALADSITQTQTTAVNYTETVARALEGYAGQVGAQAQAYTNAEVQNLAVWATTAIGAVATAVTAVENSPCMRQCNTLGNVGQAIGALEDIGLLATMVGLFAQGVGDPAAAASETVSVLQPLWDVLSPESRAQLGV